MNPELINKWLEAHHQTVDWINSNPEQTRIIFIEFMKKETGKTLSDKLIDEALSNLEITSDPIASSIHTCAKRADSLGYLGRHGYDLEGIFFDINSNSQLQEVLVNCNQLPLIAMGGYLLFSRPAISAPISIRGLITLAMGLDRRDLSPVRTEKNDSLKDHRSEA